MEIVSTVIYYLILTMDLFGDEFSFITSDEVIIIIVQP